MVQMVKLLPQNELQQNAFAAAGAD